jgi:monoamine oxidase
VRSGNIQVTASRGNLWLSMGGTLEKASGWDTGDDAIWQALERWAGEDQTFDQFAAEHFPGDEWAEARQMVARYLEGFDAAHPDRVSMQWFVKTEAALAEIDSEHSYRVRAGYDVVSQQIAAEFAPNCVTMHLNTIVEEIRWKRRQVEVFAHSPDGISKAPFTASGAIITLPLGVLKNGVRFSPELTEKQAAMSQIEMGAVIKLVLRFRERFWDETTGFLFSDDEWIPTWWTQYPNEVPVLNGWAGGPRAERLSGKGKDFVLDRALAALTRIFGLARERLNRLLEASYLHDWQSDPFAHGAYTYVTVGGIDAPEKLGSPVEDTLFYAGEATDTLGYTGTVHGAIITGMRAAEEVLKKSKTG